MKNKIIEKTFSTFNPVDYLQEYYSHIGSENESLLAFYAQIYKNIGHDKVLLEFSGGPTIYSLISAADKVKEIHFCDYLKANRDQIKLWKQNSEKAFNWDNYFQKALILEGHKPVVKRLISARIKVLRKKIVKVVRANAFKDDPINQTYRQKYDIISINFVPESITSSMKEWESIIKNVSSMLKKDGTYIMTALKNASYYKVGNKMFPAVDISEHTIKMTFKRLGFEIKYMRTVPAEELDENSPSYEGYSGFIFTVAKKMI